MKTAYVFFADGFEEVEALTSVDVLRRAGANALMVSVNGEKTVKGAHGISLCCDASIHEVDFAKADLLLLPGGMPGASNLAASETLNGQLQAFAAEGKLLAAICAAPRVLGKCGLLHGKKATCYPGFESYLEGAEVTGAMVQQDGNIVTGKGPAAALEFALKVAENLVGKAKADEVAAGMLVG